MSGTKANLVVSLCLGVALAGLAVAHIDLRQETAKLRRTVGYEVKKLKYAADDVGSKVDCSDFEDLKEEVASIRGSALEAHALISEFPDSSDLVQKYELDSEVLDLDKRIESIEDKLGIRRY